MRKCKRFISALLMVAMLVSLMCVPVMATGDCGYASEDPEDYCTFWTVYDKDYHWFICIEHKDENGDNPIPGDKEPHELEADGRCKGCGYDATPDQGGDDDGNIGAIVGEEVLAVLAELSFVAAEMGLEPLLECVVNGDTAVVRATENASETVEALGMPVEIPEVLYAGFEIAITFPKDADFSYNGSPVEPAVVKNQISDSYLESLYEVCEPEYSNNTGKGMATVSVDIINHCDDSVVTITKTFEITEGEGGDDGGNEGDVDEDMLLAYLIECSYKAVEGGFEAPLELKSVGESSAVLKATDNAEEIMAEQGYNVTIPEHLYGGFRIGIDIPAGSDLSYNGTPVKPAVIVNETDVTGLAGFVDVGDLTYSNNNGVGTATVSAVIRNRSNNETITLTRTFEIVEADEPTPPAVEFTDVPSGAYYEGAVAWAVENEITTGVGNGKFAPDNTCTRAQVVTFIHRAKGNPEADYSVNPFRDVKTSDYFFKPVLWAVDNAVTTGIDTTSFGPDNSCTRAQVVTFLWRAAGKPEPVGGNSFKDVPAGAYFEKAVCWAVDEGITKGISASEFGPEASCTRAQVVTFLQRYCDK